MATINHMTQSINKQVTLNPQLQRWYKTLHTHAYMLRYLSLVGSISTLPLVNWFNKRHLKEQLVGVHN